jgi:hypothetical protein
LSLPNHATSETTRRRDRPERKLIIQYSLEDFFTSLPHNSSRELRQHQDSKQASLRKHHRLYHCIHALDYHLLLSTSRTFIPLSHGLLPRLEQREKLPPRNFLGCNNRACWALQRIPDSMLQEVQWKRKGEGEYGAGRTGPAAERGQRVGADTSPEAGEAPIVFTTPFFAAPPSRAPPLLHETDTPQSPSSRIEEPSPSRGRTLGTGRPRDRRSSNHSQDPRIRSGAGPGEIRAPSWETSTEEVSLQFVGGCIRPDMNSLENSSQDHSGKSPSSLERLPIVSHPGTSSPTQLSQNTVLSDEEQTPTTQATSLFNTKPFEAPSPQTFSSSSSTRSSAASSFAYQLRRRVDVRLLRKRFKPAQHTKKSMSLKGKTSPPLRSPTYGVPKVVEDSRNETLNPQLDDSTYNSLQAFLDKSSKVAVTSLKLPPPKQLRKVPSNTSSEHRTDSPSKGRSPSPKMMQSKHSKKKRPGILRSSPSRDVTGQTSSSQVRARATPFIRTSSRESPTSIRSLRASSHLKQASSSNHASPVSSHAIDPLPPTPRSNDTGKLETNPFQTDDNYFSTLRTKMTARQGFTPTLAPTEPDQPLPSPIELRKSPEAEIQQETWPEMSTGAVEKRQKRGSIFSVFGLPVPTQNATPAAPDLTTGPSHDRPTIPTLATWPKGSADMGKAQWRRMSEDSYVPQYFARRRRTHTSSDVSVSPVISPNSTIIIRDGESSQMCNPRFQESSDDIGPLSPFTPLPPLREDYDRSRRVSIEIPGTPGIHHHPMDTPHPSPLVNTTGSSGVTIVPADSNEAASEPVPGSLPARRFTFHLPLPTDEQTPDPAPTTASTRKRSSVFREITSELRGTPSRRKSSSNGDRPSRLLHKRRSAITPLARQATTTSITSKTVKPTKRAMTPFTKPHQVVSLATNPKG